MTDLFLRDLQSVMCINSLGWTGPFPTLRLVTVVLITSGLLAGCGGGGGGPKRKTIAVSGKVTLGGKPLADAGVNFQGEGFTGFGKTNAQGEYKLVQGAIPGPNKVFISKVEGGTTIAANDPVAALDDPEQARAAAEGMASSGRKAPVQPKELVPADFSHPDKTKLTFDVPGQPVTDANFDL